ncbi:MAG TPA: tetraacyldisaccharide 4'-kinase [Stellaceae bacterium]|nr:tetraacyldisaccharide 4'-kinase [Stellaceae bacterium]
MRLSAPEFWQRDGVLPALLAPLGWGFGAAGALRRRVARPLAPGVPVICVGNLVLGGAGKTPIAIDLAVRLTGMGAHPHLLTRGYGGTLAGPTRVDPKRHGAREVGDEPLLLARAAPTWVARERRLSAKAAVAAGARTLVLDDGFQNPGLAQDLRLLVVDGRLGFGNRRVLPAGPLREPLGPGLARADAVVLMGEDERNLASLLAGKTMLRARLIPRPGAPSLRGSEVAAFAGIGDPGKFFAFLEAQGARVMLSRRFPDHQPYDEAMLAPLLAEAARRRLPVIATEKDLVRVPPALRSEITGFPVGVEWADEAALLSLISAIAERARLNG